MEFGALWCHVASQVKSPAKSVPRVDRGEGVVDGQKDIFDRQIIIDGQTYVGILDQGATVDRQTESRT